jgi:hypothetical protein
MNGSAVVVTVKTKRCPACAHIYFAREDHECPSAAYTAARERLVDQAARANVTETNEGGLNHDRQEQD